MFLLLEPYVFHGGDVCSRREKHKALLRKMYKVMLSVSF